jgi:hypothetical protein
MYAANLQLGTLKAQETLELGDRFLRGVQTFPGRGGIATLEGVFGGGELIVHALRGGDDIPAQPKSLLALCTFQVGKTLMDRAGADSELRELLAQLV